MRKLPPLIAVAALATSATPLIAAAPAAKPSAGVPERPGTTPPGDKTQVEHAMLYLNVLVSGLQSDKVDQPIKGTLVGCLYDNSLGTITTSMDKVIEENPGKISRENPSQLLGVMARICGYTPPAGAVAPAPAGKAPKGR